MFKKITLLSTLIFLALTVSSFAAVTGQLGGVDQNGTYNFTVEDDILKPGTSTGMYYPYGVKNTSATLLNKESGENIIFTGTVNSEFELPACTSSNLGAQFKITSAVAKLFALDPDGTDVINYAPSSQLLAPGAKLLSPGTTGDSVTVVCGTAANWYYTDMTGTFTNGGQ